MPLRKNQLSAFKIARWCAKKQNQLLEKILAVGWGGRIRIAITINILDAIRLIARHWPRKKDVHSIIHQVLSENSEAWDALATGRINGYRMQDFTEDKLTWNEFRSSDWNEPGIKPPAIKPE